MLSRVRPTFATTCTHCSRYSSQLHLFHRKPNVLLALFFHFSPTVVQKGIIAVRPTRFAGGYILHSSTLRLYWDRQDSVVYPFLVYILSTLSPDASDYCPLVTFNKASGQKGENGHHRLVLA